MDGTDNRIAAAIRMHLTNVVQGRMRLVAVARAKIDEESVTNGLVSKTQYFTLDFRAKSKGVRADVCNAEACWLKFHRSILKGEVEDFCSDLLFSESTKVCSAMECGEVICRTCTICHGLGGLWKFDVVLSLNGGGSWICDCYKIQKLIESCMCTNLTFLRQSVTVPPTTGRRMAVLAASVVSKACVPLVLWKLRME